MRYKVFYEFYITLVKIFDNQIKHSLVAKGISLAIMQHVVEVIVHTALTKIVQKVELQ